MYEKALRSWILGKESTVLEHSTDNDALTVPRAISPLISPPLLGVAIDSVIPTSLGVNGSSCVGY
jgi:hypothetical protein